MWRVRLVGSEQIRETIDAVCKDFFWVSRELTEAHFSRHAKEKSTTLLGYEGTDIVALLTIRWETKYLPFKKRSIPLIEYMEVRWDRRGGNKGYDLKILKDAETLISKRSPRVGACVNVCSEFGQTLQLLVRNGYFPDGNGGTEGVEPLEGGKGVHSDNIYIWLIKEFNRDNPISSNPIASNTPGKTPASQMATTPVMQVVAAKQLPKTTRRTQSTASSPPPQTASPNKVTTKRLRQ